MNRIVSIVLLASVALVPAPGAALPSSGGAVCQDGEQQSCSVSGCAIAWKDCLGGAWMPCRCRYQTCDDGNACTIDWVSDLACAHTPVAVDDGNPCTVDACDPSTGAITHAANVGAACDDGNPCTANDSCNALGRCAGSATASTVGAACDDGSSCTTNDRCNAAGMCIGTGAASTCDTFCYDKFGNVTKKITCAAGQSCGGCK